MSLGLTSNQANFRRRSEIGDKSAQIEEQGQGMKRGYLSEYFDGVAIKNFSGVDITAKSNQHEIGTTEEMRAFMGIPAGKQYLATRFIYLDDESEDPVVEDGTLTYYDVRANQPKRKPEYRCYYPGNRVTQLADEGDLLVVAKRRDGGMLVLVAAKGSSSAGQLRSLFGFGDEVPADFLTRSDLDTEQDRIGFTATFVLESIGVEVEREEATYLDKMLKKFGATFPPTRAFSAFARGTLKGVDPRDDPDGALMLWMDREEVLFRTLEKHIVGEWLRNSFTGDVEDFKQKSLSIQNRRKSRAGSALEGHLGQVFTCLGIRYSTQCRTENNAKPDFLFPSNEAYHSDAFPAELLTMLGVKTTCKDRWRQVLSEANRIPSKHLLTLESPISTNQTDEMAARNLTLVVPRTLQASYTDAQRAKIWSLKAFTDMLIERDAKI